jgi:hypothetical protein
MRIKPPAEILQGRKGEKKVEKLLYIFLLLTLPISKGRGFLVAAEKYWLTSSFLIGRTPS